MKGFTLIELLIALAIIALIAVVSVVSLSNVNRQEALELETGKVLSLLEKARGETLSGKEGTIFSVHFEEDRAVLFAGSSYSPTAPSNVVQTLHPQVRISAIALTGGGSDVVFAKLTGSTAQSGTIRLSLRANATASSTITIAPTGIAY